MIKEYQYYLKEILIPEDKLKARVAELGAEISKDYKDSQDLLLVCILRGAVVFLTDLSNMPWISWQSHPMVRAAATLRV